MNREDEKESEEELSREDKIELRKEMKKIFDDLYRIQSTGNEKVDKALDVFLKSLCVGFSKILDPDLSKEELDKEFDRLREESFKEARTLDPAFFMGQVITLAAMVRALKVEKDVGLTDDEKDLFMEQMSQIMATLLQIVASMEDGEI